MQQIISSAANAANVHLNELLFTVGVGTWDWDLQTGKVIYSDAWAKLLGYTLPELPQDVSTWERMVLPTDLPHANGQIEGHLSGQKPSYEAEFRMVCKDGSIIWAQDKGRVTEWDVTGKAVRFIGILQNVTRLKEAELQLRENQETLDLAVNIAELGTWDWDIPGDYIRYNDEYLRMLGYAQSDMTGSMEEWESMNHPDDMPHSLKLLDAYLAGEQDSYECEIRMKHRDGSYLWTRDVGKIVARDENGAPTRLIGGHLNIDGLKRSEKQLTETLSALANYNQNLEQEIESRTKELVEQDKMLWTVNQISRKLLTFQPQENFGALVQDCLRLLGESINRSRVYIWKNRTDQTGNTFCTQIYEWVLGVISIQGNAAFEEIPYADLPNFAESINAGRCLNSRIRDLSATEKSILTPQGIQTILIAPIALSGKPWGFIGVDNCENEHLFSNVEETMLLMSGSMLANTIEKMETEAKLREVEERTQIMLDATPLCCNLWTPDMQNMNCNEEAARLFGLASQQEYLAHFHELSPEYQPCGLRSQELSCAYIAKAFETGYQRFEWMHQKPDGTPIPAEITLVRIKYREGFIVAGYTRDLREFNQMLATLQSKENDLRAARDEALLSSKAKSNFLANMSHEIRTPMNAISGLAEIILRESQQQQIAEHAKGIKIACHNLLNIINDILDISKIESGKLEICNAPYGLASLLSDVITIARVRLGDKPLMFVTDIDSRLPAQLIGDEMRIKQILINMLSNAIKFTSEGHIALCITGTMEQGRATLQFCVKDSGMGIKEDDLARLFAEFERVNTTKNRSIEGTGLGLAISKQLCEMMGGTIGVQSVYGQGSTFTAIIPQECPLYQPLAQVHGEKSVLLYEPRALYRCSITSTLENLGCTCVPCKNQSELYENINAMPYNYILTAALHLKKVQSLVQKNQLPIPVAVFADYSERISDKRVYNLLFPTNCLQLANLLNGELEDWGDSQSDTIHIHFIAPTARVLLVDDNPVNLRVAEGLMSPYQFTIDTATDGLEAVAMVQQTSYDLVLMDHMMPEMDGIDATIAIRQLEDAAYKTLPIVALTANALVGTREMFIREGMNDFLAKPIEMNKLVSVLLKWLPPHKVNKIPRKEPILEATQMPPLAIKGVNTTQGILSVGGSLENYLQILAAYHADGTQKCASLPAHVAAGDFGAFRTEIHAVKSTCATIGADALSAAAAQLETAAQNMETGYIADALPNFLSHYQEILAAIYPILPSRQQKGAATCGDPASLKTTLVALHQAAELANIGQMEACMKALHGFAWQPPIATRLAAIQEYLAQFDYDGVLACTQQLLEE